MFGHLADPVAARVVTGAVLDTDGARAPVSAAPMPEVQT